MTFDKAEDNESIQSAGATILETKSYFTYISEFKNKKLAFYIKKPDVVKLFKEFAFSKIVPLDIILYKMAVQNKAEIIGFSGENTLSYSRKINGFEEIDSFFTSNNEENSSLLFEANSNVETLFGVISNFLHIKKALFIDRMLSDKEKEEKNIIQTTIPNLIDLIENEEVFVINDKFSDNYQSVIYKKETTYVQ
jgi:hypothetical protein